ncbi:hypothetical protein Scep_020864 [Stephania cephalantha]|uniref:Uncharacterized protein n=1 Tax=Stephania cephalantha TaxID=152367 RepID=A0AAP0F2A9_9MAGN
MVAIAKAEDEEAVFDSGRPAAGTDGLFSDVDPSRPVEMEEEEEEESTEKGAVAAGDSPLETVPAPTPISGNWVLLNSIRFTRSDKSNLFPFFTNEPSYRKWALKSSSFIWTWNGQCNAEEIPSIWGRRVLWSSK